MSARYPVLRFRRSWLVLLALAAISVAVGLGSTGTTTQTLNAILDPIAKLSVPSSLSMTAGSTQFSPYSAAMTVSYRARTTPSGSGGTVTLQVSSDFSPTGGPSAASGTLTYTCGSATLGTACSGTQTASTTTQTPVLTLPASACTGGGGSCSSVTPNTVTLNFSLTDSPTYVTGTYSATLTLTISAT